MASWNLGGNWTQEDKSLRNLLNHGLAICTMTLLIKDHKSTWFVLLETEDTLPSRSDMGGNVGGNRGISEFLSLVLEPVAKEMKGSMEIDATSGLLSDIEKVNKEIIQELEEASRRMESSEHLTGLSHVEECAKPPQDGDEENEEESENHQESFQKDDKNIPEGWKEEEDKNIPEGWKENYAKQRSDIGFYLEKGAGKTSPKILRSINLQGNKTIPQEGK